MGGNFCQILELGGTTIKGRRVSMAYPDNLAITSIAKTLGRLHFLVYYVS